ncbi:MAG: glutamine-hydrolyzing carbamoyl-phosphate synthase small subunit [Candidatus Sumerlaeia bacterium]|nr:glutamine-hydrolyzing carbamoyl-phosphate synthase small subunit [Candidatus Sumerlaeia bacterium]
MSNTPAPKRAPRPPAELVLANGMRFSGESFGAPASRAGEIVFNTGMVGYPEALTDPSYRGQILALTYPLQGNYGMQGGSEGALRSVGMESDRIQASGLVVADYAEDFSHWSAGRSLGEWLASEGVPAITGVDTRALTRVIRQHGTMLGKIIVAGADVPYYDPDADNLVAQVSAGAPEEFGSGTWRIVVVDCGCKENIVRNLAERGLRVKRVPWDYDFTQEKPDGFVMSNGPGDPTMARPTIERLREVLRGDTPVMGICLGHQLMALALGAKTYKLKFGHRGQNQPVRRTTDGRCFITSQNHSFAVDEKTLPQDWEPLFTNLNDGTNEGMRHASGTKFSVQFHPEAAPGPVDTATLFDEFLAKVQA